MAQSKMRKPTAWGTSGADWSSLPVNAHPGCHGWELYEAIAERVAYIYGDDWRTGTDAPDEVLEFGRQPPPLADCIRLERSMFDTLSILIPQFVNWTDEKRRMWTEKTILEALEEGDRLEPSPYYLSAAHLWQSYKIVNLLRQSDDIISISWIDEAESIYTAGDTYDLDKDAFKDAITFNVSVIQPGSPGEIYGKSGLPGNVSHVKCSRDPCHDFGLFCRVFEQLRQQYASARLTVGLFVDSSGSMGLETIQPAYDQFRAWIAETYPEYRIVERQAPDERWLSWTLDYINDLRFQFDADVLPKKPDLT